MPYSPKAASIVHSDPGTTARVHVFDIVTMDTVLRMADRTGGSYDVSKIEDGPEEKILRVSFEDQASLEIFKTLCQ